MNPLHDPNVEEFLARFRKDVLPALQNSSFTVAILDNTVDVKLMLEIGASLLLEKPLIIMRHRSGMQIPRRLRQLADAIIEFDEITDPDVQMLFRKALKRAIAEPERK